MTYPFFEANFCWYASHSASVIMILRVPLALTVEPPATVPCAVSMFLRASTPSVIELRRRSSGGLSGSEPKRILGDAQYMDDLGVLPPNDDSVSSQNGSELDAKVDALDIADGDMEGTVEVVVSDSLDELDTPLPSTGPPAAGWAASGGPAAGATAAASGTLWRPGLLTERTLGGGMIGGPTGMPFALHGRRMEWDGTRALVGERDGERALLAVEEEAVVVAGAPVPAAPLGTGAAVAVATDMVVVVVGERAVSEM